VTLPFSQSGKQCPFFSACMLERLFRAVATGLRILPGVSSDIEKIISAIGGMCRVSYVCDLR
jgi:hypothetical protein